MSIDREALNKMHEGRREWAAKHMCKQKENKALSEEEHEALECLCEFRHWLHCADRFNLFNEETVECQKMSNILWDGGEFWLWIKDLPMPLNLSLDFNALESEADYFENLFDDADDYEDYSDWLNNSGHFDDFCDTLDVFNEEVENYLSEVDGKFGTQYCPTGATRTLI